MTLTAALLLAPCTQSLSAPTSTALSLETIMAHPDWIGPPVQSAYWAADTRSVYYSVKRANSPLHDLHKITLPKGDDRVIDASASSDADGPPIYDRAKQRAAFIRQGDVFIRDLRSGKLKQLTRSTENKSDLQFSEQGVLSFRAQNDWFVFREPEGVIAQAAILRLSKDPDAAPKPDDLRDMQLRIFSTLKKLHDDAQSLRQQDLADRAVDTTRSAAPFYLGDDLKLVDTSLSPDANWMLVVTEPKNADKGFEGQLTKYVTESGYEEFEKERTRVGRNRPAPQSLLLLNLRDHTMNALALDTLPGIHEDPLKAIREENAALTQAAAKAAPDEHKPATDKTTRDVQISSDDTEDGIGNGTMRWSHDGHELAFWVFSLDHKDRWLARVDLKNHSLQSEHRLSDAAWVNSNFNEFGWLNDNQTLWYQSEESGFSHLYTKSKQSLPRQLTQGTFEVSQPLLSADGKWFYFRGNAEAPYVYDVYRIASTGGTPSRITTLKGVESFALDHSGRQVLVTHSASYMPSQLALVSTDKSAQLRELTDTRTAAYRNIHWIQPEIVEIPSTHFNGKIYGKVYRDVAAPGPHPAVVFVHGAGYTQDVHLMYPYYFHEQMYHNWLVSRGYVVISIDYRASEGYGRDWRTAIYRQMGTPELEDLLDAKQWLMAHAGVDGKRVGIYGGSYGGFMTLMALFRAPGQFAAGASLRPVTDWMQYNHDYTASILNEPQVDPAAYRKSSPIEYAEGLADPLLIAHGVIDDNVLFADSMRLYQRLIELHKDNFTIAPYPLDRHGFSNADSWLDEYKRIDQLFEQHVRRAP